jgi:hypothetical protein
MKKILKTILATAFLASSLSIASADTYTINIALQQNMRGHEVNGVMYVMVNLSLDPVLITMPATTTAMILKTQQYSKFAVANQDHFPTIEACLASQCNNLLPYLNGLYASCVNGSVGDFICGYNSYAKPGVPSNLTLTTPATTTPVMPPPATTTPIVTSTSTYNNIVATIKVDKSVSVCANGPTLQNQVSVVKASIFLSSATATTEVIFPKSVILPSQGAWLQELNDKVLLRTATSTDLQDTFWLILAGKTVDYPGIPSFKIFEDKNFYIPFKHMIIPRVNINFE